MSIFKEFSKATQKLTGGIKHVIDSGEHDMKKMIMDHTLPISQLKMISDHPQVALSLAKTLDQLHLSASEFNALSKITPGQWQVMIEGLKADLLFHKYINQQLNQGFVKVAEPDKKEAGLTVKKVIVAAGIVYAGEFGFFAAVFTILAAFCGLMAFVTGPETAFAGTALFGVLAFVCSVLAALCAIGAVIATTISSLLWLLLPEEKEKAYAPGKKEIRDSRQVLQHFYGINLDA